MQGKGDAARGATIHARIGTTGTCNEDGGRVQSARIYEAPRRPTSEVAASFIDRHGRSPALYSATQSAGRTPSQDYLRK